MSADELTRATAEEARLRAALNRLVRERAEALESAARAGDLARLPGAEGSLHDTAERQRALAARLDGTIEDARTALRRGQAEVERLRADAAGA